MSIVIKNASLIDDTQCDIRIDGGIITALSDGISPNTGDRVIDAGGCVAAPGLVDIHVHLRDPGFLHKEDILSGCAAAAAGGFTHILCMPNTSPVTDNPETILYIKNKARTAPCRVHISAAITVEQKGGTLSDLSALKDAGAEAFTDDGHPVMNQKLLSEALVRAHALNIPLISHCEDMAIVNGGIIHEGSVSAKLGVKGIDRRSENLITERDIKLAEKTGTRIHIAHVSTKEAVDIIRQAKARGASVTCETAPHYLLLTHEFLMSRNADYRMNPPLREESDRLALIEGIKDGTIDCIATDHAPHSPGEKSDFLKAPNGVTGLETSLSAMLTFVQDKTITLERLIELMSINPRRILGIPYGGITVGAYADLVLFDMINNVTVDRENMRSRSKNTPFHGMTLRGSVKCTVLGEVINERNI